MENSSNKKFTKRVFGCVVIKSIDGNYNADFTKQPRTLLDGTVYATDKALKYTIRHFLHQNYSEDKILYFTRYRTDVENGQMIPKSLKELYEHLFGGDLPKTSKVGGKPKWNLFYFDSAQKKVVEKGQKMKEKELTTFLDKLDNEPEYKKEFIKIAKEGEVIAKDDIKIDENEDASFYFYQNKEKQVIKLEIDNDDSFEETLKVIDIEFFGGYDKLKILHSLLQCIDVRLFGATYTGDTNVSIHGPVQINHAKDRFFYKNRAIENLTYTEQIKSPVRNDKAKGGDAEMTTIGSQSKSMEAHYVHHFSVNPKNLEEHVSIANQIVERKEKTDKPLDGLTESDIQKLIEGLRSGASNYSSTAKTGVENELLIWVELKKDCKIVLPNFTELIKVNRNENGKTEIDLADLKALLEKSYISDCIEKISIYHNDVMVSLVNKPMLEGKVSEFDILTGISL